MLLPRIIPSLLLRENEMIKSFKFSNYKYLGDPINIVRIFNEKNVDELLISDICATSKNNPINYELLGKISKEARMPLCYSGGVKNISTAKKLISLGFEKIGISSAALSNLNLLNNLSRVFGSQSIVLILDLKFDDQYKDYYIYTHNGNLKHNILLTDFLKKLSSLNILYGEIILNFIENDGQECGYDIRKIDDILKLIKIPLIISCGAGKIEDIKKVSAVYKHLSFAASSIFVFKGKYKAVLINYPKMEEKFIIK